MAAAQYKMILIPEAQDTVLQHTPTLSSEVVQLQDALGRVLGSTVTARDSLPPFPASIKDGYAVLASDGAGDYHVVGESRAGHMDDIIVTSGRVAYITTGAPVPPGADAVVQVEDTDKLPPGPDGTRRVRILKPVKSGQDIRPVGSDIMAGAVVLEAGELVGVAEVGILATVGAAQVQVVKKPRVGVLSTGDEVVEPSTADLGPGQIRDCNRSMLLAAVQRTGAVTTDLGVARDTEGHLEGCLERAMSEGLDVLVTSGGVSMGDRDLIKPLLERHGVVHFGRVKMKPGKPLTFATVKLPAHGDKTMLIFGLPGNPVSSFACFNLVVLPAIRKMSGWVQPMLRRVHVRLTSDIKMDPERPEYHRATVQWGSASGVNEMELVAISTGNQISSRLLSARSANVLMEIPQASGVLPKGTKVSALLVDDLQQMPQTLSCVPVTSGF